MYEIEPSSFCSIDEYYRFLESRVQAEDVSLGGLYLALADIRSGRNAKQAFKLPLRVKDVDLDSEASDLVTIELLDLDFQVTAQTTVNMLDGIVTRPPIKEAVTDQIVRAMYLKDYEDFAPPGPVKSIIEEEIPVGDLIPA